MFHILKHAKANVKVSDNDNNTLFEASNLFTDSGRTVIALVIMGALGIDKTKYVCDLGDGTDSPSIIDIDLSNYIDVSIAVNEPIYPAQLLGEGTGVHFQFEYSNSLGSSVTIRELGLFYRPNSDSFPDRNSGDGAPGYLLARLKTTYSSIVVGNGRSITIDWKIIF
jgi:hypothetical protein